MSRLDDIRDALRETATELGFSPFEVSEIDLDALAVAALAGCGCRSDYLPPRPRTTTEKMRGQTLRGGYVDEAVGMLDERYEPQNPTL